MSTRTKLKKELDIPKENSFTEKVFLFSWAFFSNTTNWFREYTSDIVNAVTQNYDEKTIKDLDKRRRRKAYLKRLKHQSGVLSPSKSNSDLHDSNVSEAKVKEMENQLSMLKEQLAIATKQQDKQNKKSSRSSKDLRRDIGRTNAERKLKSSQQSSLVTPVATPPVSNIPPPPVFNNNANIPPPPVFNSNATVPPPPTFTNIPKMPAPPSISITPIVKKTETVKTEVVPKAKQPIERSLSIADMIKNCNGKFNLKPVQKRSPKVSPKKAAHDFHNELFSAIKSKFNKLNNIKKQEDENSSDVESTTGFDSPIKVTPIKNSDLREKVNSQTRKPLTPINL
ncbi:hypothetical protein ABK040_004383 [Willaertia magna]